MSGAVIGSGVIPAAATARPDNKYVGVEYNPRTREIIGEIDARLEETRGNLKGSLQLTDQTIPVHQQSVSRHMTPDQKYQVDQFNFTKGSQKGEEKFKKNGRNLHLEIRSVNSGIITGSLSHMTGSTKRAFKIQSKSNSESVESIISQLTSDINRGGD